MPTKPTPPSPEPQPVTPAPAPAPDSPSKPAPNQEQLEAHRAIKEDPLAHLRNHPNHAEIVAATRQARYEASARRVAGQALVDSGWSIVSAGEDSDGHYYVVVKDEDSAEQRASIDIETGEVTIQ